MSNSEASQGSKDDLMNLYYSPDYTTAGYGFDTTRKAGWIADALRARPLDGVRLVAPAFLTEDQLQVVHQATYVEAVRAGSPPRLAGSSGLGWDPALWDAVCASNGGVVAAALDALASGGCAGSLSSGLHHARHGRGAGFCTFNGLALAARAAIEAGARRVLILDVDAHVGDGTVGLVRNWPEVTHVDITVCPWAVPDGHPARSSLDVVTRAGDYLPVLERRLSRHRGYDLCLYNAGMDPHEDCDLGGLPGITARVLRERERLVFDWASSTGVPVAFVLAGGYAGDALSRDALVGLHRLTLEAAASGAIDGWTCGLAG
jgi:acetoin utilization deacetylase AcuC-like enzyme